MKRAIEQLKNLLSRSKIAVSSFIFLTVLNGNLTSQIANYVNNGGFEELYNCNQPNHLIKAKYWRSIDSITLTPFILSTCPGFANSPSNVNTYQWARSGKNYGLGGFFWQVPFPDSRLYFRNRLKQNLVIGKTYCVKFYVNIANTSTYGCDGFAAYFGDNSIDTITKTSVPLVYLTPQIQSVNGNIIADTLNWTLITGTFVATGNEKHMLIGNFKSDAATNTTLINPTHLPSIFTDACIDDVSCIDIDLPAFAGTHTFVLLGDSVYLGRERDVGIDEACTWYKLPNTTTAIDTAAGIWVKPISTSTYVVVQDICGNIKSDTVFVSMSAVGLSSHVTLSGVEGAVENKIKLYPNPVNTILNIVISVAEPVEATTLKITNTLGQPLREEDVVFKDNTLSIQTSDFKNGIYFLNLTNKKLGSICKRFVIAR